MKLNVLVAETDEDLATVLSSYLLARECEVHLAETGVECLEKVRRFSPHVLVLAEELLWGGGCGVVAWLRESNLAYRPAVVLTATELSEQRMARSAPVVDRLVKPFPLANLLRSIENAARSATITARH
jgi:DNA-binding response OmpR family regulator